MSTINNLSSLAGSIGNSGSGTSSAGGLGQGINVQQFVGFAVANQQAAITALQTQQTNLGAQTTELSTITSDLNTLSNSAFALSDPLGALNAQVATSSNSAVVSATASGTAVTGTHSISVTSLATTSSYYTNALLTSSSTVTPGNFQIQVGTGTPVTVTVDSTNNTLSQLAASINSQNAGVSANVIQDATGYRLALVSSTTGAPGDIKISGNTTGLSFTKAVTGTNANLTVDGIPISSASNTVSNVINGVTLNLQSAPVNGAAVAVNVSPDTSQAAATINAFVAAYNATVVEVNNQFNVASNGSGGGVLESDNTLREAQSALLGAASYSITGNNGIVNLASIGVNMNNDGTLTVDSAALNSALASNFSGVQNLMQNTTTGFSQNLDKVIQSLNGPGTGMLTLDAGSITSTSQGLTQQISDLQAALAAQEITLTSVYSKVNATLQELPLLESQMTQQLAGIP
jgi:flagellar hook-associated protein 2